jgi:hypothetical protein
MRRLATIGFAVLALTALSACVVTIGDLPTGVTISNANYETDRFITINGQQRNVICDDQTTILTYSFSFSGNLETWESYLQGVSSGRVVGRMTFDLDHPNVNYDATTNTVSVRYQIQPGAAPTLVSPDGPLPQAIVVNPTIRGYSTLYLNVNGHSRDYQLFSNDIPVVASCG